MRVHFGCTQELETVVDAIPLYADEEFHSPTRSTVPLLSLLIHAPHVFRTIVSELGIANDFDLFLEYTVRSPQGSGKASHTDVLLKAENTALAIEAKWTEPMYQTISEWRGDESGSDNKNLVVRGWLSYLQERVSKSLVVAEFDQAIYQMLHRAASAAASGSDPRLAYFVFQSTAHPKPKTTTDIKEQLSVLWEMLGEPDTLPFYVVEIEMTESPAFNILRHEPKGEATKALVTAALRFEIPLFEFHKYSIHRIG